MPTLCGEPTKPVSYGFDPSALTKMNYAFVACFNLRTIWVNADWKLPSTGISGSQTFYQCTSLVGSNGTKYSDKLTSYAHMRIDAPGVAGYLTAG